MPSSELAIKLAVHNPVLLTYYSTEKIANTLQENYNILKSFEIPDDSIYKVIAKLYTSGSRTISEKLNMLKDTFDRRTYLQYVSNPVLVLNVISTKQSRFNSIILVIEACADKQPADSIGLTNALITGPATLLYLARKIYIETGKIPVYNQLRLEAANHTRNGLTSSQSTEEISNRFIPEFLVLAFEAFEKYQEDTDGRKTTV